MAVIMVISVRCNCACCKTIILFGMALRDVTSLLTSFFTSCIVWFLCSYNVEKITDE